MKYLLMALLLSLSSQALGSTKNSCEVETQDVNTPVPKHLKDGEIIVRTKDGKEEVVSANEYKVVRRRQQFKVKQVVETSPVDHVQIQVVEREVIRTVEADERKNLLMAGVRYDFTHLSSNYSNGTGYLNSNRATVFDLSYFRRQLFSSRFGAGIGLDTNGTPRGIVGLEF